MFMLDTNILVYAIRHPGDAINDVLEAARQDGRLAEISMKYFGVDMTKAE